MPEREEVERIARELADHCEEAALFYEQKPGLSGAGTDIALYRTVAQLARQVAALARPEKDRKDG